MSKKDTGIVQALKMFFGIFMVLVYLGMAWLMAINYFGFPKYLSWFFAVMFGLYGIYRGYREITGEHSYGMRRMDNGEDKAEYSSYTTRLKEMEDKNNEKKI